MTFEELFRAILSILLLIGTGGMVYLITIANNPNKEK